MKISFGKDNKHEGKEAGSNAVPCPWCGKEIEFEFAHTHETVATTKTFTKLVKLNKGKED